MTGTPNVVGLTPSSRARRDRWSWLRDLVGGALLLAFCVALWTVTWAAVAGPLRPAETVRVEAAAALTRG